MGMVDESPTSPKGPSADRPSSPLPVGCRIRRRTINSKMNDYTMLGADLPLRVIRGDHLRTTVLDALVQEAGYLKEVEKAVEAARLRLEKIGRAAAPALLRLQRSTEEAEAACCAVLLATGSGLIASEWRKQKLSIQ